MKRDMKAGLFVDNANLIYKLDWKSEWPIRLDFEALPRVLAREASRLAGQPVEFAVRSFYCTYRPDDPDERLRREPLYKRLRDLGWSVSLRPAKRYADGHWEDKGGDLEIALDAHGMALRGYLDCVAILTDDSDFAALFERLPLDVKGFSVGWERSMGKELRSAATPIYLDGLLPEIAFGVRAPITGKAT